MKNFGFHGYDNVIYIGTNGKMTEISAAMGLTGLESLDETISVNRRNYGAYQRGLEGIAGLRTVTYDEGERSTSSTVLLEVDEAVVGIGRDRLMELLQAENVLARRYFFPGCHRMEPYRLLFPHAGLLLPETERLAQRILSLPNGASVGGGDIETICGLIRFAVGHAGEIRRGPSPNTGAGSASRRMFEMSNTMESLHEAGRIDVPVGPDARQRVSTRFMVRKQFVKELDITRAPFGVDCAAGGGPALRGWRASPAAP